MVALGRFRNFISAWFTREVACSEMPQACTKDSTRKKSRKRYRTVLPPVWFVWGIIAEIIVLIGLIILEAVYIIVTKSCSSELLGVISGLISGLVTMFVMGKRGRSR
jgi:hypothetical protein